jgi:serine/threonine-protein kinase
MIGSKLGKWIIDRELGRGGMGQVYLAHAENPADGEPAQAAVKVLAPELARDPGFLQRFLREIAALQQLDHPHIVRFFEAGVQDGHHFYAMEFVEGATFEKLVLQSGRLPWAEVLDMALQICPALKHAHDRGIIHRDIKPSNLIRAAYPEPGFVKLTDFGIAQVFATSHLTETGAVVGTGEYISPEQAAGKQATRRSDLYSLGIVLYTLLTGRTPFQGKSPAELLHKHLYAQFDKPTRTVPDLPHDIEELICQLLEKDPEKRPADAGVLHRQLDSIRRKLERQGDMTTAKTQAGEQRTVAATGRPRGERRGEREGPATLMSRLVREELDRQNYGGPIQRFFNHPVVLAILFILCIGGIALAFWPASEAALYEKGMALWQTEDPDDWDKAFADYLDPLQKKHPDSTHNREIDEWREQLKDRKALRKAEHNAKRNPIESDAQWFYLEALRLRQRGDDAAARRTWENLVKAFADVKTELPWVVLARNELRKNEGAPPFDGQRWQPARAALDEARNLRDQGQREKAESIWTGLEALYKDDASATAILDEIKRDRGH